jgi:membrane protein DedA with SNARE-associated domain
MGISGLLFGRSCIDLSFGKREASDYPKTVCEFAKFETIPSVGLAHFVKPGVRGIPLVPGSVGCEENKDILMADYEFNSIQELLEIVNAWVLNLISTLGYPGLGLVMFLENVFPPIPSEIILPLAGSLTLNGEFSLAGITLVGMLGSVAGAWVFYGIGYWFDEKRVRFLVQTYGKWFLLSVNDLDRALIWFQRYGSWVVFFGRMIPMVRSLISIPAGLARMHWAKFTLFTALGTACWSFLLALAGQTLGKNWVQVEGYLARYEIVVWIGLGVGIGVFVLTKLKGPKKVAQER